jgi:hypothetical protein
VREAILACAIGSFQIGKYNQTREIELQEKDKVKGVDGVLMFTSRP